MNNYREKVKGGFFGLAVGDALGATVEFMNKEEIEKEYGVHREIIGGGWLNLAKGETTDDTQMMLAVARGLLKNQEKPIESIGENFVTWYKTNPKSIGNTVRHSLENYLAQGSWGQASFLTNQQLGGRTDGNGSLMRTLPVSYAYRTNLVKMDITAGQISRMTHHSVDAEVACLFYNRFVSYLLENKDKWEAFYQAEEDIKRLSYLPQAQKIPAILKAVPKLKEEHLRPTGYVIDTLITAIVQFLNYDSFEEIIVNVVKLGGDADTTGAVTGGLAGTYYGFQNIPTRWVQSLLEKEILESIAEEYIKKFF